MPNNLELPVLAFQARAKSRVLSGEAPGDATWLRIPAAIPRSIDCQSRRTDRPDVLMGSFTVRPA